MWINDDPPSGLLSGSVRIDDPMPDWCDDPTKSTFPVHCSLISLPLPFIHPGELKLNYLKKPYIVTTTTFQMAVLILFNNQPSMQYKDMADNTKLNEKELNKTVQSLVDVKMLDQEPAVCNCFLFLFYFLAIFLT